MLSIVTEPDQDYIFVTDFDVLAEHLDNLLTQACRTVSTSATSTSSTLSMSITPSTSVATPATVPDPGESMLEFLHNFLACVVNKSANLYFYCPVMLSVINSIPTSDTMLWIAYCT